MTMKNWKQKIVYGLVIGCAALALGGIALANEEKVTPPGGPGRPCMEQPRMNIEQHIGDKLSNLVKTDKISQAQADQILAFFKAKGEERKAVREKMQNMTPEERQAYREEHKGQRLDMIADLKAAANLTDEQAKLVAEELRPPMHPRMKDFGKHVRDNLNNLVAQNTITQTQADQVLAFFKAKGEEHKANFEKVKGMTPEERHTYMEQHRPDINKMIAELKASANLSDEQAKAVFESLRPHHDKHSGSMTAPQQ